RTVTAALPSIGDIHEIGPVPPAAAQCLEQRRSVGETVSFGLDEAEPRLLVRLVGVQHGKIGRITILVLESGEIEVLLGGVCGRGGGVQSLGIVLKRSYRVRASLDCG